VVTANYYKEQARVFALWAMAATDPALAQHLRGRAEEYLALAEQLELEGDTSQPALAEQLIQPKPAGDQSELC
jgi:hypothetical protein